MLSSAIYVKTRLPDPTLPAAGRPSLEFFYLYTCRIRIGEKLLRIHADGFTMQINFPHHVTDM